MAQESTDDTLSEMARHRGFKLVKSRRRKPGSGDYGLFGLTDMSGTPLLGITANGLTATAADVEDYLRGSTSSGSWKRSAAITPDPPKASRRAKPTAVRNETRLLSEKASGPRARHVEGGKAEKARETIKSVSRREAPVIEALPPEAELKLRRFKSGDEDALRQFLAPMFGKSDVLANLPHVTGKTSDLLLALLGPVVGYCAWTVIPTLQHGPVGRITLLIVGEDHRRRGIGSQLLAMARDGLSSRSCQLVEVMSDIEFRNAHGFFRARNFEQKSYRFTRAVPPG